MAEDRGTNFDDIPIKVKLEIMEQLSGHDKRNSELVCKLWFHMASYIQPPTYALRNNDNIGLKLLKRSLHENIGMLKVRNFTTPLPIFSSTRYKIPTSYGLSIMEGNSTENVLKLLRYFAKPCNNLLLDSCFGTLQPYQLTGLSYDFLKILKIWVPFNGTISNDDVNHLACFAEYLRSVNLRKLEELYVYSPLIDENGVHELFRGFNDSMAHFLQKKCANITSLTYKHLPLNLVHSFQYLKKLTDLDFTFNTFQLNGTNAVEDFITNIKLLKNVRKLTFCDDTGPKPLIQQALSAMVEENCVMLEKLDLSTGEFQMNWVPNLPKKLLSLRKLCLQFDSFGESTGIRNYQMKPIDSVQNLNLAISGADQNGDWANLVFGWIMHDFKSLTKLKYSTPKTIAFYQITWLISSLPNLKKLVVIPSPEVAVNEVLEDHSRQYFRNKSNEFFTVLCTTQCLRMKIHQCPPIQYFNI